MMNYIGNMQPRALSQFTMIFIICYVIMQKNIEENVIAMFKEKGYEKHEYLTQKIAESVLHERSQAVFRIPFKPALLIDIMDQCRNQKLQVSPKSLAEVISEAHYILTDRLNSLIGQNGLINDRKIGIKIQQDKLNLAVVQTGKASMAETFELNRSIAKLKEDLEQMQNNKSTFQSQIQFIQQLFKIYIPGLKKKKFNHQNPQKQPKIVNTKLLTLMFFFSLIGISLEFLCLQLKSSFLAIMIYLQVLFLLFVGYYSKNAVKCMIGTGLFSIMLDILGFVLLNFFSISLHQTNNKNTLSDIALIILNSLLAISIIIRIGLIMISVPLREPPIQKTSFFVCGNQFTLNTRLNFRLRETINYGHFQQ